METHGGWGKLYAACYVGYPGVVFERLPLKADHLARQRPEWAVYETDSVRALQHGAGAHLEVNFLDVDPYGEPWPVLDAFFGSTRPFPNKLVVVVQDGLRQALRIGQGWKAKSLEAVCGKYGNAYLHTNYVKVCKELLAEKAAVADYHLTKWTGYTCGHLNCITQYCGVFVRP